MNHSSSSSGANTPRPSSPNSVTPRNLRSNLFNFTTPPAYRTRPSSSRTLNTLPSYQFVSNSISTHMSNHVFSSCSALSDCPLPPPRPPLPSRAPSQDENSSDESVPHQEDENSSDEPVPVRPARRVTRQSSVIDKTQANETSQTLLF